MNIDFPFRKQGLNITGVFQYMMENGYNPSFEYTHIQFECDGNTSVVECEDGFVTVRIFFSIEADEYDLFIEASNLMMTQTYSVKSVVLEDRENIVFSCEFFCDNLKDFKSFFPRAVECIVDGLNVHKSEMRKLLTARKNDIKAIPDTTDDFVTGITRKLLS